MLGSICKIYKNSEILQRNDPQLHKIVNFKYTLK